MHMPTCTFARHWLNYELCVVLKGDNSLVAYGITMAISLMKVVFFRMNVMQVENKYKKINKN